MTAADEAMVAVWSVPVASVVSEQSAAGWAQTPAGVATQEVATQGDACLQQEITETVLLTASLVRRCWSPCWVVMLRCPSRGPVG